MSPSAADEPLPPRSLGAVAIVAVVIIGSIVAVAFGAVVADRGFSEQRPQASFAFSYDDASGDLTVRHAGGDAIDGRHLYVVAGDRIVGNFSVHETVTAGDRIVVSGVERTDDVAVVWRSGGQATVIARWS